MDTYHVYYTNGTYEEFVVTNGKDGADGINGADGLNGTDGKDGADGNDGADGKDGGITIAIAALACGACSVVSVALLFVVIKKKRMI